MNRGTKKNRHKIWIENESLYGDGRWEWVDENGDITKRSSQMPT
jgi:hypothetical protein